jgi:hypothetical protein
MLGDVGHIPGGLTAWNIRWVNEVVADTSHRRARGYFLAISNYYVCLEPACKYILGRIQ